MQESLIRILIKRILLELISNRLLLVDETEIKEEFIYLSQLKEEIEDEKEVLIKPYINHTLYNIDALTSYDYDTLKSFVNIYFETLLNRYLEMNSQDALGKIKVYFEDGFSEVDNVTIEGIEPVQLDDEEKDRVVKLFCSRVSVEDQKKYSPETIRRIVVINDRDYTGLIFKSDKLYHALVSEGKIDELETHLLNEGIALIGVEDLIEIEKEEIDKLPKRYRTEDGRLTCWLILNNENDCLFTTVDTSPPADDSTSPVITQSDMDALREMAKGLYKERSEEAEEEIVEENSAVEEKKAEEKEVIYLTQKMIVYATRLNVYVGYNDYTSNEKRIFILNIKKDLVKDNERNYFLLEGNRYHYAKLTKNSKEVKFRKSEEMVQEESMKKYFKVEKIEVIKEAE